MKTLYTTYTTFAKRVVTALVVLMTIGVSAAWAEETLVYTLTPASGSNNSYAGNCDITIDGIIWNLTGNSTVQPWRIGGKSLTNVDRAIYSKTPISSDVSKIEVTHGTASSITVNSLKLIISDAANGNGETIDVTFKSSATITIELPEGDYSNKYFKFLYNVTVSDSDNRYLQFTNAKFYTSDSGETPGGGGETPEPDPDPDVPSGEYTATLVTNVGDLKAGDQIIIAASNYDVALSTMQNTNNRGQATVTKEELEIAFDDKTQIITLEAGTIENTYAFNVGNGYLYAASSGSNYLKTQPTNNDNGSWTIEINNTGIATIKAQGTNTRNWLRYNATANTGQLFSCYASGQGDVSIYKYVSCSNEVTLSIGTATNAEITDFTASTYTCSDEEAERQVTITIEPNTGYELNENSVSLTGSVSATRVSFDQATGTYIYQFEKDVSGEVTVSVTATAKTTTISFDQNGGEGGQIENKTATYDQPMPTLITLPTSYSHNFIGYFDAAQGGTKYYNADGTSAKIWDKIDANYTLHAQWTEKDLINYRTLCSYTVTLDQQGGMGGSEYVLATYTLEMPAITVPTREGYTFGGYWTETNGEGTQYYGQNGTALNHKKWDIADHTTLYAKWTANEFKVIFDANGGDGTMADQRFTYDVEQPLTKNIYTKTGYTFTGWNDNENGTGPSYADQEVVKNLSTAAGGRRTLYAQWTANTNTPYVVKHYKEQLDGTYSEEADETENLTGTTDASVTPTTKTYDGFTPPSQQTVTVKADGNLEVKYYYTRNSYILTWDYAGGSVATEGTAAGSVKFGAAITAPTLTKTGYNFAGWSPEVPATMPATNSTYTAQWNLITYTVNWMLGDVQYVDPTTVSVETPLTLPTAPANDALGCCANAFVGWSVYAQPTKEQVFNDVANAPEIDENKTFHAVFATTTLTEGSATATFNEMGYTNAEKVTEIALGDGEGHGDATILFAKDQSASNYPAYYTASGALHAYSQNTITINSTSATSTITNVQFTFAAKEDGSNTISANVGTYADDTWNGSAESVVFTIGGETGHRKITSITVTTQAVEQYTNYVTKCTYGNSPTLGDGTITYNSGSAIEVKCGKVSAMNSAATLTFPNAADLTCPVTLAASDGFLISTSKSNDAGYQTSLTVSPYKSGAAQAGKLRTIYVRANAIGKTENYSGTITISGGEVTEQTITVNANVNCQGYTLTLKDHLGNTIGTPTSHYEGDIIELPTELEEDACSENYTFDGWSESAVEYGSLVYNQVTFQYTMPNYDVTLYPVYQCNKTADYHRVTSDLGAGDVDGNNWAGDYLIAYSDQIFADGRVGGTVIGGLGRSGVSVDLSRYINNDIIDSKTGNDYCVRLEAYNNGYVLKTQDDQYNYYTANGDGLSVTKTKGTAGNYAINIKFESSENIKLCLSGNAEGSIFSYSGNVFKFYGTGGKLPIYLYKKSPLYTTSLICGTIDIQESDIVVTSTKDQSVKVSVPVKLTSPYNDAVAISGANVNSFSVITKENVPVNTEEVVNVELVYSPQAYDQLDTETITLTATNGATTSFQVTGRSLPETFAIVAKVGNVWYALPSQGLNSTTPPAAYPVEVNDMVDPTAVTAVPENADWSLRQVYASSGVQDRHAANGHNLVFVNNEGTPKALNASISDNYVLTDAQYSGYYETNPGLYEWTPTTSDLETYTLTNAQRTERTLNVSINTVFGVHYDNKATTEVRFLPITGRYTPAALQVVEWKENSVVIMYNGNPAQTASVSVNGGAAQETVLSSAQRDIAVYELAANGLAANPTQRLSITIGTEKVILSIPYIISGTQTDLSLLPQDATVAARQEVAKVSDLVILKGATLTAAGASNNLYKFRNVTIYGGGKLVIPSDKGFGVNTLTLRIGGMTEDNKYDYVYPEFVLNGKYTSSSGKINLDYVTTKEQYYTFVAPFEVETKDIKYPVDIYGSNVKAANRGSFEFQYYDGEARANGEKGWKVVEEDPTDGATLTAHQGYTFYGMPTKVSVNGGTSTRQKFGIHRIPMTETAANVMSHENTAQTTAVSAYPSQHNINAGWNLIGNPYMSTITGLNNNSIQTGTIVLVDDRWQWSNEADQYNHRFIVFPSNDGEWYYTSQASNATLPAFKNFFVQIAGEEINAISIPFTHRAPSGISARRATYETDKDIEMAIVLEKDEANSDQMDFLINDAYGAGFDYNADFTKMMNNTQLNLYGVLMEDNLSFVALDHFTARSSIAIGYQVPSAGEYTLRISDKPYVMLDRIEALYVTDHEMNPAVTTNLMEEDYVFQVGKAEINDTRFTISFGAETNNGNGGDITTDMSEIDIHSQQPQKFLYDGRLYILRDGKVYSATGHEIKTINE